MLLSILAIVFGLGVLTVIAILYADLRWQIKSALIAVNLFATVGLYPMLLRLEGWPVQLSKAPDKFDFYNLSIEWPEKDGDLGAIDILLKEAGADMPRLVRFPFDKDFLKTLQMAQLRLQQGQRVTLVRRGSRAFGEKRVDYEIYQDPNAKPVGDGN